MNVLRGTMKNPHPFKGEDFRLTYCLNAECQVMTICEITYGT
jgi:hypothetical protein